MAVKDYSTTASENDTAGSVNFAEGQLPSTVNNSARQVMADIRAYYDDAEFRDWGHTVTQASTTTFLVATDVTAIYVAGRRIRCTDSSTLYGYVLSSSYGAPNTTVTVTLDSGSLSGSLTAVAVGPNPTQSGLPQLNNPQINEAVNLTSTSTELNLLDGATVTTAEINILDGVTATATELNYTSGVTSAIQTQIDSKIVILDTPLEIINTTTATGAWTAYAAGTAHDTLTTAGATSAILKCYVLAQHTAAAAVAATIYLRNSDTSLVNGIITRAANAGLYPDGTSVEESTEMNTTFVNLGASGGANPYEFDYYTEKTATGALYVIHLVGYTV